MFGLNDSFGKGAWSGVFSEACQLAPLLLGHAELGAHMVAESLYLPS